MCGRFASFLPVEAVARIFGTVDPLPNTAPTWKLAPTQTALVVRRHPKTGERYLDPLVWGLIPHFTKDLKVARKPLNARTETVENSGIDGDPAALLRPAADGVLRLWPVSRRVNHVANNIAAAAGGRSVAEASTGSEWALG